MITGVHSIIYSTDAEADRMFLRDVLELTNVDVVMTGGSVKRASKFRTPDGHGWYAVAPTVG